MTIKKLIIGSVIVGTFGSFALPADARTNVYLSFAPPPVYYEPIPSPRVGWVWAPGYWDWRGQRHYWVAGHWVRSRAGYVYYAPRWHESGGRWQLYRGGWYR
jgi:hypothetical protein